jgi:hypothetical protein
MKSHFLYILFFLTIFSQACKETSQSQEISQTEKQLSDSTSQLWDKTISPPSYQKNFWGGYTYYKNGKPIEGDSSFQNLVVNYPYWKNKGDTFSNVRITILSARIDYHAGETIRIAHILDMPKPGSYLSIMGPKSIVGEYINDSLATPPGESWVNGIYDGIILPSPGVDYNFKITKYKFKKPGTYNIQWKMGKHISNILKITVE